MRALLLSAYHTDSHRRWAEGVVRWMDEIEWTLLDLPGRHFAWRMRGNPLSWHTTARQSLQQSYDLVLATSMVDLSTLIGLYPHLGQAHKVLYFHENQFAYPLSPRQKRHAEPLMVSLYGALSADTLLFNSDYNRQTFLAGAHEFLRRMPERLDLAFIEDLRARSTVLPVPLEPRTATARSEYTDRPADPPMILWNHRWEYDKQPEDFFAACSELDRLDLPFRLAVAGQQFREQPSVFERTREELAHRIICWGQQPRDAYERLLHTADIVVSTANHEFQGLSVMEAVQSGCRPLVPDRLCYPEYYAAPFRYDGTIAGLVRRLSAWLGEPQSMPEPPPAGQWEWPQMLALYRRALYDDGNQ